MRYHCYSLAMYSILSMWLQKIFTTFVVVLVTSTLVTPAHASITTNKMRFKRLAMEDENSVGSVLAIHQDRHGFVWVGGRLGLARYDGYDFEVFRNNAEDPDSIISSTVHDIAEDNAGNLWLATEAGVDQYDYATEKFIHYEHHPNDPRSILPGPVFGFHFDKDNTLWLASRYGLMSYDRMQDNFIRYPRNEEEAALASDFLLDIDDDGNGNFYLATGHGLKVWNKNTGDIKFYQAERGTANRLQINLLRSVLVDSQKRVWVGSENGLLRFEPDTENFIFYPTELDLNAPISQAGTVPISAAVWDIFEDSYGTIWIATDGFGLSWLSPQQTKLKTTTHDTYDPDTLSSIVPRTVAEDNNGDIWVGNYPSGINVFERHTTAFNTYKKISDGDRNITLANIKPIIEDEYGNLWLGIDGEGLSYYNLKDDTHTLYSYDPNNDNTLGSNDILDIMVDHEGTFWIGSWSTAITKYSPKTKQFERIAPNPEIEGALQSGHVWVTFEDSQNTIWVGTMGTGLYRYLPETSSFYPYLFDTQTEEGLIDGQLWSIYEDSRGYLWIASQGGLSRMDRQTEKFTHFTYNSAKLGTIGSNEIRAIFEDSQQRLWIGTNGGGLNLFNYTNETFTTINQKNGLPSNVIVSIIEDDAGLLWLGTNSGICSYDPDTGNIRHYDKNHGLQGNEFNVGSAYKTRSGELIFGGLTGYTRFHPQALKPNDKVPPVVFTDIEILNKPVQIGVDNTLSKSIVVAEELHLNYKQNIVTLHFAALNFRNSSKNQYAYKLEGFDTDWHYVNNKRSATYTNLDAGRYRFHVIAANDEGLWNKQGRAIDVIVSPAPWRTAWAYLLYILLIFVGTAWYVFKQRQTNRLLEQKVRDRTRDLEDAYDKLEKQSLTDPLTGLANRRFFEKFIYADIADVDRKYQDWIKAGNRIAQPQSDIIFFIIDIDGFKKINDSFGHAAGDRILETMSKILKQASRDSDYIIRWGGEEFLLMARFVSRKHATEIAERIRSLVEKTEFDIGNDQTIHIACSIGFSPYPFSPSDPYKLNWEKTINTADIALYAAKNSGRNSWVGVDSAGPSISTASELIARIDSADINVYSSICAPDKVNWK